MLEKLKMEYLNSTKTTYKFSVDGIEWDESALEIPAEKIGAFTIVEEGYALLNEQGWLGEKDVTIREIHIIRKAQNPNKIKSKDVNLEEIYIILTEDASIDEIKEIQEELLDYGVQLTVKNLQYNAADKIENIEAAIKVEGKSKATAYWTKAREGYKYMVLYRDWKNGITGAGSETELLMQARESKDKGKVFILGNRDNSNTNQFLMNQMANAKKIQQAKKDAATKPSITLGRRTRELDIKKEEIYIILTEEADLEEIIGAQKEMLDLGIKLMINHCQYNVDNTKIEKISVQFEANGNTKNLSWDKNSIGYNFLIFGVNKKTGETFGGQGKSVLKHINSNKSNIKLITYGTGKTLASLKHLETQLDIKEKLSLIKQQELAKNPNWKGHSNSNNTTYVNITKLLIEEIKNRIQEKKPLNINYYLDGVKEGERALDIPTKLIKEIRWNEENLIRNKEKGEVLEKIIKQLNIFVSRKVQAQKPKAKKGFQYVEECDCYIPETFTPNGNNVFQIEGARIGNTSSFQVYDRWGEQVFEATPFKNDWKVIDDYGEQLKPATYYFTFQTEEGKEVAQGFFKIVDASVTKEKTDNASFVNSPNSPHYVIALSNAQDLNTNIGYLKSTNFMLGNKLKLLSINDFNGNPLIVVRRFNDFDSAKTYARRFKRTQEDISNLVFLPINQTNYRKVLELKSLEAYEAFYVLELNQK